MLTNKDKEILKNGTFQQQMAILIDHFEDSKWSKEANDYFRGQHKDIFNKKLGKN